MTIATRAEHVRWDLTLLYPASNEYGTENDLVAAKQNAEGFRSRLHGRVAELDPSGLADAVDELQEIQEKVERAQTFAYLHFASDTGDPARGAFLQEVTERA